jgi:phage-related protein
LENHRTVFHSYHKGFVVIHTYQEERTETSASNREIAHACGEQRYNDIAHSRRLIDNTDVLRRFAPITMDWNE